MKNIHIIPTDKPSRFGLHNGLLEYAPSFGFDLFDKSRNFRHNPANIYITSDEEIKEGDRDFYILANDRDGTWINRVEKVIECKIDPNHGKVLILSSGFIYIDEGCKIILTTDQDLIKDGVQAIDDKFLEWFVKNPSCESVEIEKTVRCTNCGQEYCDNLQCRGFKDIPYYKITIPQEEPKCLTKLEIAKNIAAIGIGKKEPKQEIQERNKQIALMLGKKEQLEYWKQWVDIESKLKWHSDWNWLMEAVEFIEKLRFNTKACINCENDRVYLKTYPLTQTELSKEEEYFAKFISVTDSHFEFCFNIASSKKEAVFMAVSDFAKLYNNKEL